MTELLELPHPRLPSLSTLRRIMVRVDFVSFTAAFNGWVQGAFGDLAHSQLATNGKGIKISVSDYNQSYQDFVALVSAFSVTQGVVMGLEPMRNLHTSEVKTVEFLLDKLQLKGVGHGHTVERRVSVLDTVAAIAPQWQGVQRIIRVERWGTRNKKTFHETMFYISSLALDAAEFADHIRQHWQIENRLHWVKDVVLKEDHTPVCDGHALVNFAIVRTIALNLFRSHGYDSITQAIRRVAHDISRLFSFF